MKKLAMMLALCLLLTGAAVYAEDVESTQTEASDIEMPELEREVWRGEVTAVDADSVTLKILEYNPENPRLPVLEGETMELPEEAQPEESPAEDTQTEPGDKTISMNGENEGSEQEEGAETALPESTDGTTVEIVHLMLTAETLYYSSAPAEDMETELQEGEAGAEESGENAVGTPEEDKSQAPVRNFVFEEATLADVAVGNVLTVEVVDGTASIVVIETDVKVAEEADM